jgi:DNA transformation protein
MKPPDPFAEQVVGLLTPLGPVRSRRMFGGHGIFMDDVMFALIAGCVLYLKADAETEDAFREAGSQPFTYKRNGREFAMSYWRAPEGVLDDMAALTPWAERALGAARRAKGK